MASAWDEVGSSAHVNHTIVFAFYYWRHLIIAEGPHFI